MKLAGPIDLPHSLQGGQAFLWEREGDTFRGVLGDALVELAPRAGGSVEATGTSRAAFASYFRLERADASRRARLAQDPVLSDAIAALPGLRLLRQDPWQTTVAFLTSANNNVPRIELILRALVARFGTALSADGILPSKARSFPTPAALARAPVATLRACGLGYRAPFLRETARMVARGEVDLAALRGAPREEVRDALLALPGVGPKVADCIALFALDVDDAFPMDRWMMRAMEEAFGQGEGGGRRAKGGGGRRPQDVADFARGRWGRDAGLAQQYLFHLIRMRAGSHGTARLRASSA